MNRMLMQRSKAWLIAAGLVANLNLLVAADSTPPVAGPPEVDVLATDPTALVGASSAAFTFVRTGPTNADLAINYTISGTASNGVDYKLIASVTTIPDGFLATDLVIQPLIDVSNRGNKTVLLTLATNAAYALSTSGHRKASVLLVDDAYNDQAPTVSLINPTNGTVFTLPANITLIAQAADVDDTIQKVTFFANDDVLGRATNSPFTLIWTNPPPGRYDLFARAVDQFGKSTLSAPISVIVTNVPTIVTILSPTNNQTFGLPAMVSILATATNSQQAVKSIDVLGDDHLLGTFTSSPVSLTWSNVAPGNHTVTVRATDALGFKTRASTHITVTNAAPTISLTSPADGSNYLKHSDIVVSADVSDSDGTIKRVMFLANDRVLGSVKQPPYTLTWKNANPGVYQIRAIAMDQFGKTSNSQFVLISVSK